MTDEDMRNVIRSKMAVDGFPHAKLSREATATLAAWVRMVGGEAVARGLERMAGDGRKTLGVEDVLEGLAQVDFERWADDVMAIRTPPEEGEL
jgi:hypothetical protein